MQAPCPPQGPWPDSPEARAPFSRREQALQLGTNTHLPGRAGAAVCIDNAPQLIERLQAFGLIESNGRGGWQMTECCEAGLATCTHNTDAPPEIAAAAIRPWTPRTLARSDIR
jgi:hypothetical protein